MQHPAPASTVLQVSLLGVAIGGILTWYLCKNRPTGQSPASWTWHSSPLIRSQPGAAPALSAPARQGLGGGSAWGPFHAWLLPCSLLLVWHCQAQTSCALLLLPPSALPLPQPHLGNSPCWVPLQDLAFPRPPGR